MLKKLYKFLEVRVFKTDQNFLYWVIRRGTHAKKRVISWLRSSDENFFPIFITGAAGSGTTLLSGLLDQLYENAACMHESNVNIPKRFSIKIRAVNFYPSLSDYWKAIYIPDSITDESLKNQILKFYRGEASIRKKTNIIIDKSATLHLVRAKRFKAVFPSSKFLMIFRDPVSNIEGLRRKWQIFREASLEELCYFWESLHKTFIEETEEFASDVRFISYEQLLEKTDRVIKEVARFCNLRPREQIKRYDNKLNTPGKGYRNVIKGKIRISNDPIHPSIFALSNKDADYVKERLSPMYGKLLELSQR